MGMFISLYHVNAVFFLSSSYNLGVRVFKQTEIKCVSVFARTPPDITLCFCFTVSTRVFISLLISLMPIPPTLVSAILVEAGLWHFHVRRIATILLPLLQDKLCFMEMFIWTKLTRMEPDSLSLSHSLCRLAWNSITYSRLAFTARLSSCFSLSSARVTQSTFSKLGGEAGLGTIVDLGLTSSLVEIAEHKISISITRYWLSPQNVKNPVLRWVGSG